MHHQNSEISSYIVSVPHVRDFGIDPGPQRQSFDLGLGRGVDGGGLGVLSPHKICRRVRVCFDPPLKRRVLSKLLSVNCKFHHHQDLSKTESKTSFSRRPQAARNRDC